MNVFGRRPPGSPTVAKYLRSQSRHLAVIGAVASVILLAASCVADSAEVVRPGPPAALPKAVRHASLPVTESLPAPEATCTNAPLGWSLQENHQVGVNDVRPSRTTPGVGEVVGYLDSVTAVCGQTMSVHLSAPRGATRLRLRALRIGDYQDLGSRLVWQSGVLAAHRQEEAVPTGPDRIITERWRATTTFAVDADWPPGMYLIEIAPLGQGRPSFMPLIVRTSGVRSPHLVVVSDLTWLAYNDYGGRSLYFGPGKTHTESVANRSYVASTDRPLAKSSLRVVFSMNIPLIRFLSRNGLSYDVTTDSSLDAVPVQLRGQPTILIGGHSEYWTKRMYDAAVQARDAGTNFGFLGANEVYWQGRIERDASGRETALTVYRDSKLDRLATSNPSTTSVQWRHAPLLRDPAALVGEGMSAVGVSGPYVVNSTPSWLFRGTGLQKGDILDLAIGNEADAQEHPNGHSPANLQVVLRGVAQVAGATKPTLITAGYYTAPSGAEVFAAGTTYWVCNLDSTCPNNATPLATSVAIQRITLNLVKAFAVARAGRLHPSVGTPYESAAQLVSQLPLGRPAVSTESQHLKEIQRRHG